MSLRNTLSSIIICILATVTSLAVAPTVDGKRTKKPAVRITVGARAMEGVPTPISWTGRSLGRHHRLVIERPVGTRHVWRKVMRLSADRGSGVLPARSLGEYQFRLAAFRGKRLVAKHAFRLRVYGVVSFADLVGGSVRNYATPSRSFPYVTAQGHTEQPALAVKDNRCISAHVDFVPGQQNGPGTGTLTLVQETRDPVAATVAYDEIGALDAELTPGETWALNTSYYTTTGEDWEPHFYVNGSAVCSTREALILDR